MAVTKDEQVPLKGTRDIMTGLRRVTIHILDRTTHQSNHLHQVNGKENDIKYTHATAFSLVQDTWAKAFNRGYFNTWSGLTAKDIDKMTKSESTIKDHIAQSRKKYRSTITNKSSGEEQAHSDPVQEPDNNKKEIVMATVDKTHKIYTDQMVKYPITYS